MSEKRGPRAAAVAVNLRRLRKARGWTVQQVADLTAGSAAPMIRQALSKVENSGQDVRVDEAFVLAEIFGVPLEQLCTRSLCDRCGGCPPAGFTCNACSTVGGEPPAEGTAA